MGSANSQQAHCHPFTTLSRFLHPVMVLLLAELAAEREVLRCQAAVRSAPADDLRRLQERLAS